jgi:transcription-repair coupling factor (superfamily II helicase)
MAAVGYDTYCRLLAEAIGEESGRAAEKRFETTIDVNIDAYIPEHYIKDEFQKLEIYKKISLISDKEDFYDIQEEIEDRYGDLPKCVQNLLDVAYLKAVANSKFITDIKQKNDKLYATFKPDAEIDPLDIERLVNGNKGKLAFVIAVNPYLTYKIEAGEAFCPRLTEFLSRI